MLLRYLSAQSFTALTNSSGKFLTEDLSELLNPLRDVFGWVHGAVLKKKKQKKKMNTFGQCSQDNRPSAALKKKYTRKSLD